MADNELELAIKVAEWQSSRQVHCLTDFIRHIQIWMSGLEWSIEALPLPNTTDYTFNIIEVKRSESPTAADLPAKLNLLLAALQMYIRSVFRVETMLDKLYACSPFFYRAENDKRWWVIIDAEIMAVACKTAREATQQAAEAAAAFLVELMEPLEYFPQQNELCATSFSATERWNGVERAVDAGDVLQWCNIQVLGLDGMVPSFEFEVALQDFLQGNDAISRIGVVNSHPLKVTVDLEDKGRVVCSQEGVETEESVGLGLLLPDLVRNYITTALERNEGELGNNNTVQGLLQRVVGYLTFLPGVCVVCGSHRLPNGLDSTTCSNICEARKGIYGALPLTWTSDDPLCFSEMMLKWVGLLKGRQR